METVSFFRPREVFPFTLSRHEHLLCAQARLSGLAMGVEAGYSQVAEQMGQGSGAAGIWGLVY
jgi:hypothetical protein